MLILSVSILALREKGDDEHARLCEVLQMFQSSPFVRRATIMTLCVDAYSDGFNPRPS